MPKKNKKLKKNRKLAEAMFKPVEDCSLSEAMAKAFGNRHINIDSSRGPEHAKVDLKPGQTREEIEELNGCSLEELAARHMKTKKDGRLFNARLGYILDPGPNGIYDAIWTERYVKGSIADKYKFDGLGELHSPGSLISMLWTDKKYTEAEDCTWDETFVALALFLRWDEEAEILKKAYLEEGCKLTQYQIEKKTCKWLIELYADYLDKVCKYNGGDPDSDIGPAPPFEVHMRIWKEIWDKIEVEATDYTEEATKHWPAWAKETLKSTDENKPKKKANVVRKTNPPQCSQPTKKKENKSEEDLAAETKIKSKNFKSDLISAIKGDTRLRDFALAKKWNPDSDSDDD